MAPSNVDENLIENCYTQIPYDYEGSCDVASRQRKSKYPPFQSEPRSVATLFVSLANVTDYRYNFPYSIERHRCMKMFVVSKMMGILSLELVECFVESCIDWKYICR